MYKSVRAALREYGEDARKVILSELQQMVDKRVWTPVNMSKMSREKRRSIIRSSMFLKEKFISTGAFEKLKARLVAGGNQQDKTLYDNLSSPTVSKSAVFAIAAIAAAEGRVVAAVDIGGAYLNADMHELWCDIVHATGQDHNSAPRPDRPEVRTVLRTGRESCREAG